MIFRQLFDHETWTYTYLMADPVSKEALIIDPVLEQMPLYQQLLDELELGLKYALDTHVHADHITASGLLAEKYGAITVQGKESQASGVGLHVTDGDKISFGSHTLIALSTPGHTDDSYCYYLVSTEKRRLFTGDTLLIRGSGRTDFQNGDARLQYDSIFEKLFTLPNETLIYPGHDYRGMTFSTIGEEKRFNPRLQVASREEYVQQMNNLKLAYPRYIDVAVPANLRCGLPT